MTKTLPAVEHVTLDEFKQIVQVGDIFATKIGIPRLGKLITWGQRLMLQRFGYTKATAAELARYTHVGTITDVQALQGFEAVPPVITDVDIMRDYGSGVLMVLRCSPALTQDEQHDVLDARAAWRGIRYDVWQYALYPFYMAYGWVPAWWDKLWNNPEKPVCSGLCIHLCQAAERLTHITDHEMYPPARMAVVKGLHVVGRYQIAPTKRRTRRKHWWM